jgi:hypothetical protein
MFAHSDRESALTGLTPACRWLGGDEAELLAVRTELLLARVAQGESVILHCHRLSLTVIP